jgi:hypothetical protein
MSQKFSVNKNVFWKRKYIVTRVVAICSPTAGSVFELVVPMEGVSFIASVYVSGSSVCQFGVMGKNNTAVDVNIINVSREGRP